MLEPKKNATSRGLRHRGSLRLSAPRRVRCRLPCARSANRSAPSSLYGVPAPYGALRDPTPDSDAKLRRGAAIFDRQCSSCHGWSGRGTGPEGFFLVPAPADLAWLARTPKDKADPYIYWSVAEGGPAFESEMPAFKHSLSEQDIWSVTAYLRSGMPYANP